jgi:hypothetical protein
MNQVLNTAECSIDMFGLNDLKDERYKVQDDVDGILTCSATFPPIF